MILRVQYRNFDYDYVDTSTLDRLIADRSIRQFFRPSEDRWVNVSLEPIRGMGGDYYGPDRRNRLKTDRERKAATADHTIWIKR